MQLDDPPTADQVAREAARDAFEADVVKGFEVLCFGLAGLSEALVAVSTAAATAAPKAVKAVEHFNLARGILMGAVRRHKRRPR